MSVLGGFLIFVSLCLLDGILQGLWPFRRRSNSDSDWWRWYNAYLQSPDWKEKRKGVLLRSGGKCERCGKYRPIDIHHLPHSYKRIPHERPWDLAALCYDCHRGEHPGKRF